MSEVYNFKRLSEVDVQEAPTDATTVLAVEDGIVKQIPAGKFGGGGGGGGGGGAGSFIVNISVDMATMGFSGDKTFAEIAAAIEGGAWPVAKMDGMAMDQGYMYMPLFNYMPEQAAIFALTMNGGTVNLICMADDSWTMMEAEA